MPEYANGTEVWVKARVCEDGPASINMLGRIYLRVEMEGSDQEPWSVPVQDVRPVETGVRIARFFRRKRRVPVVKFGEEFILDLDGRHLAMAVTSVSITKGSTYGTIATLDHFMVVGHA